MNKTFGELAIGDRFTFNGKEYSKTQEIRISCCQRINAQSTTNSNERIKLETSTTVTVNA
jgi:hypothetical protein